MTLLDQVSGLWSRLGQRAPGGGDVWADVRVAASQSTSQSGPGLQGGGGGGGSGGGGSSGGGSSGGGSGASSGGVYGIFGGGQRGHDDQDSNAACHKVEKEGEYHLDCPVKSLTIRV